LIHQLPSEPAYLRVKVGRRLAKIGAVAIKNSVYLLPAMEACREDFSWTRREIADDGGEAVMFEATTLEGLTASEVERLFRDARARDYRELERALDEIAKSRAADRQGALGDLARVEEQLAALARIDFFPSGAGNSVRERVAHVRKELSQAKPDRAAPLLKLSAADYQGRTWVTRRGVKVDRVASAWLIRRFIDPAAKLKYVEWADYKRRSGELRFDTPDGEFTHRGDLCSFEVLCSSFDLKRSGLKRIAEIVHDLDVKDGRYRHPETEGVAAIIEGIVAQHSRDDARVEAASALLDALLATPKPVSRQSARRGRARVR
jgi:hypothetical protein